MSSVTLASSLPADDRNGLGKIAAALCDDPEGTHVIVAVVDCTKITTKVETGDVVPTARIRAVEAFNGDQGDQLRNTLLQAYERRTGQRPLDLEGDPE